MRIELVKNAKSSREVLITVVPENQDERIFLEYENIPQSEALQTYLKLFFKEQKYFYKAWGLTRFDGLHEEDGNFDEGCDGFRSFMMQYLGCDKWIKANEQTLAKVLNIITAKIKSQYAEFTNQTKPLQLTQHLVFPSVSTERQEEIDINMLNNAILVLNNGCYTLSLQKLKAQSLDELKLEVQQSIQNIYDMQLKALKDALKEKEEEIKKEIQKARFEGLKVGLAISQDWEVEDDYLIYKYKITANKVKKNNAIYDLDTDKFYIQGLKVPIRETLANVKCEEAYHPNVSGTNNKVCLGDLEGEPLTKQNLEKLVEELKTANLDSAYDNTEATEDLEDNFDEYITEESETEIWEEDDEDE
jgi:hypothetical protein